MLSVSNFPEGPKQKKKGECKYRLFGLNSALAMLKYQTLKLA